MKKYISFFRIRFIAGLQYRAAAWGGIATQFAWGFMTILMFRAFYESGQESFPMTFPELSSYIWMRQAFFALFGCSFDIDIFDSITSGGIAYELCRPCDLYFMWFTKDLATRVSRTILRCMPILLVAALLPYPYNITLPPTLPLFLLFVISAVLGVLVLNSFITIIYMTAFYTISSKGVRSITGSVIEFLGGSIIPLPFFPESLQKIVSMLPFASIQNTPFLIYVGHMSGSEIAESMAMQVIWLIVLFLLGRIILWHSQRRVVVQGG